MNGDYYISLISKSLSNDELKFESILNKGIDNLINYSTKWLQSNEANNLLSITDEDDFKIKFKKSKLYSDLNNLMNANAVNGIKPLKTFYNRGVKLAEEGLERHKSWNEYDDEAFNIYEAYVYDVILNLNQDVGLGVRNELMNGVKKKLSLRNIGLKLLEVPYKPITSFKPVTRSNMIATTEYSRGVNTGTLQTLSNHGVNEVNIITTGLPNVCDVCLDIESKNPYTIEEAMKLLPVHPHCYMPDTEVFTNKGWKHFDEIEEDDKFLSLNPNTLQTEFLPYVRMIHHENKSGKMIHIYNKWFDTCITPDHDCFVLQRKMVNSVRGLYPEFRKPSQLNSESYFLRTVENNNNSPEYININGLNFKTKDYVFFMAWYLSEGSVLHDTKDAKKRKYPISITQIKEHNRELLEKELTRICNYLDIKLYIGKKYFELHSKELYDYLLPFGYSYQKYIPNELLKLSKDDLRYFLDNYVLGDGHKRYSSNEVCQNSFEEVIATSSKKMVDSLSYLILLSGYYPSISLSSKKGTVVKHHNGEYAQNHNVYTVSINRSEKALYNACEVEEIDYDGVVSCVELPKYHTLWTRRNGKTSWNGNCACSFINVRVARQMFNGTPIVVDLTKN